MSDKKQPLWMPDAARIAGANLTRFIEYVNANAAKSLATFDDLHGFSIDEQEVFWPLLWDFCDIRAETRGNRVIVDGDKMPGARYFPDARLNFAENLLRRRDHTTAMIFRGEDRVRASLSWAQLYRLVSRLQPALREAGIRTGERVAAMMPNMPETCAMMLAATASGALWSSCSPDFGERGVLDRFGQIEPKVMVACDGYYYNGKVFDISDRLQRIAARLASLERLVIVPYIGRAEETAAKIDKAVSLADFIGGHEGGDIDFVQLPFDHPLYILFSSGTTGAPKCIVHSAGGVLVQHLKEQQLHGDVKAHDKLFYFTTCGWMMWNWLMSGLASEATLILYDGSPFYPSGNMIFDYADDVGIDILGTSAKFIDALKKSGLRPKETHSLKTVRTILSTGSPLAPESFDFVYDCIKSDVHLASVSGGTDICACFVGGNPTGAVWRGEIQANGIAMASDVWDDDGNPMPAGKGELVCTRAFPSMPLSFWNDPDGKKYHDAYFARWPNIWHHGDFAEWTEHGGMIIHGRSDATLNPGGVRIGTAEIYAQVEQLDEITEALAIGQIWEHDSRIVLFVVLAAGAVLDDTLAGRIKTAIRTGASPRHVPEKIIAVDDIPRTKSGKISELAVRDVVHGREVKNTEALANPEALALYRDIPELQS